MKRLTITFMLLGLMLSASAQTAREEIKANKYLSASNYLDYDNYPATAPLTPTPKGYEPYLTTTDATAPAGSPASRRTPTRWLPCARRRSKASSPLWAKTCCAR